MGTIQSLHQLRRLKADLKDHAAAIGQLARQTRSLAAQTVAEHLLLCKKLRDAKRIVGPANFTAWLQKELPGLKREPMAAFRNLVKGGPDSA